MNNQITISCRISTTDASVPLGVEIWLDDQCVFDQPWVKDSLEWCHDMEDNDGAHELRWILKNKTQDHTQVDEHGNIVKDSVISIQDLKFDGIELGHVFVSNSSYRHDHNGTTDVFDDEFYGVMGCNGTVSLKFTTPIYLWLLENL